MHIKITSAGRFHISTLIVALLTSCSSKPSAVPAASTYVAVRPTVASKPSTAPSNVPVLKFNDASIKAIQAATKTATVRKGVRLFGTATTVRAVGGNGNVVMLDLVSVTSKKVNELTPADAKANGSDSLDGLKTQLTKDYPQLGDSDVVTVIVFKLKGNASM